MTTTRTVDRQVIVRARQIVAVTLASMALNGVAQAQAPEGRGKDLQAAGESAFLRADTNRDGRLSPQEAGRLPAIAAKFEQLDRNQDGSLDLSEFMAGYTAKE